MNFNGKNVLVYGYGKSGKSAAKLLNKKASCLMSVVDSKYITEIATPEERQTGLNTMIKLALDSAITL